jgi:intracellular sulfur oxidation DsrE/DsrF family protein
MITKKILIAISALLISIASFSQKNQHHKKDDLLFMLRQTEHINQAMKTIGELKTGTDTKLNTGNIAIIVCGEVVTSLTTGEAEKWVEEISRYSNVSIYACGLSLDKFNKKETDLIKGIKYAKNGFIKAFELQKQGYLSVEL